MSTTIQPGNAASPTHAAQRLRYISAAVRLTVSRT